MEKLREDGEELPVSPDDEIEKITAEIREKRERLKKLKAAKSPYGHVTIRLTPEKHNVLRDAKHTYDIEIKDLVAHAIDRELERLEKELGPRKQRRDIYKKKKNKK